MSKKGFRASLRLARQLSDQLVPVRDVWCGACGLGAGGIDLAHCSQHTPGDRAVAVLDILRRVRGLDIVQCTGDKRPVHLDISSVPMRTACLREVWCSPRDSGDSYRVMVRGTMDGGEVNYPRRRHLKCIMVQPCAVCPVNVAFRAGEAPHSGVRDTVGVRQ